MCFPFLQPSHWNLVTELALEVSREHLVQFPHSEDEKTEAQTGEVISPIHAVNEDQARPRPSIYRFQSSSLFLLPCHPSV